MTATTRTTLLSAISAIAPLNSFVAASLNTLLQRIDTYGNSFSTLETGFSTTDPQNVNTDQALQDLNQQARDDAAAIFSTIGAALGVQGAIEFASLLLAETATITASQIAYSAAGQAADPLFDSFLESFGNRISLSQLPPLNQGTNNDEIFVANPNGGTMELLGGNDIFIPGSQNAYYAKGGSGNDFIFCGESGSDSIDGGLGNDTIISYHGAFQVSGNEGNDWIQVSGNGNNSAKGNEGSDTLIGGASNDRIFGTDLPINSGAILSASASDSDYLIGRGGADSVNGSIGNDYLVGDNFSDSNSASENSDLSSFMTQVNGKVFSDGIGGNDTMIGYAGNDIIAGGAGNDLIYGDDGPVSIGDGSGNDHLYGDRGNDIIYGGGANDLLDGGNENDILIDDTGTNTMYGGIGEDRLRDYTTTGNSYLYGGAGHDIYEFRLNTTPGTAVHHDVIRDLDGDGQVTFANTLTNTTLILSGPANYDPARDCWTMGSGGTILMKLVGADLVVKYDDLNYITIKNFGDGDPYATYLGIRLPQPTPNSGDDSVIGDGHPLGVANPGYLDAVNPLDDTGIYDVAHDPIDMSTDSVNGAAADAQHAVQRGNIVKPQDPLVLDLNHNGIESVSLANSNVHFDLDGNGFAEKTGWISADDGFLVRDLNSNGSIDNISEMFGNSTQAGLVHLATLDSNADGKITAADTAWNTLKVWQDTDGDGVTDAGELHSLSEYGIDSFTLASQFDGRSLEGNIIARVGSFSEGAVKGDLAEIFFQTDNFDSQYIGTGGTGAVIDPTTLDLPLSRGYGNLPSLQQAMLEELAMLMHVNSLRGCYT